MLANSCTKVLEGYRFANAVTLQRCVLRADLRELDRPTPKLDLPVSKSDTAMCPDIRRDLLSKADTEEAPGIACVFA